ncbi:hypothetical protein LCGC14_1311100 [marine sediment metagenome]
MKSIPNRNLVLAATLNGNRVLLTFSENTSAIMEIIPLTESLFESYIEIGKKAYDHHYLHLWKNQDSSPYHERSFTRDVLLKDLTDGTIELFLIHFEGKPAGVLKIIKDSPIHPFSGEEALLLEKIYILNVYTGKGIGKEVLAFTEQRAKELSKKIIWLETMQNSRALHFYLAHGFEINSETLLHYDAALDTERPMYRLVKSL